MKVKPKLEKAKTEPKKVKPKAKPKVKKPAKNSSQPATKVGFSSFNRQRAIESCEVEGFDGTPKLEPIGLDEFEGEKCGNCNKVAHWKLK